jgi:hypothetical protein
MHRNTEVEQNRPENKGRSIPAEVRDRRNSGPPAPESATLGERRMTLAIKTAQGSAEARKAELDAMEAESARATRILVAALIAVSFIACFAMSQHPIF